MLSPDCQIRRYSGWTWQSSRSRRDYFILGEQEDKWLMSELCSALHNLCDQGERFRFPFEAGKIPPSGIYVLFEAGEHAHGGDRVVRVGTHTGINRLRSRLQEHFIKENKDRSIFRKNIGRALLNRAKDPFLEQWNWDLTSRKARETYRHKVAFGKQREVERQVTEYIQKHFSFVVFRVEGKEQRLALESRVVSTVSRCNECRPSNRWLGLYSPKSRICRSGLWQMQGLYKKPLSKPELAELSNLLFRTKPTAPQHRDLRRAEGAR